MKEHTNKYLVVLQGEVVATRGTFKAALQHARKLAKETKQNYVIDAIEQLTVTTVYGGSAIVFGRTE